MGFNRQPAALITGIGVIVGIVLVAIHADPAYLVATTGIVGAIIHYFVTPVASPVLAPGTPVTTPGGDTANPTLIVARVSPAIPARLTGNDGRCAKRHVSALNDVATIAHDVLNHISAGRDVTDARLAADLATLRTDLDRLLGAEPVAGGLLSIESHEDEVLALVRSIASHFRVPPPPAPRGIRWTATYRGTQFTGRTDMGASIQEGFGVDISAIATDALGEPDALATQVLSSDNPAVVTVVDHGGGSARADITAGATAGQTANVVDTVTDADGNTVSVPFAITVLAGDATGAAITAGAPTKTP